jgi:hypothetical protein
MSALRNKLSPAWHGSVACKSCYRLTPKNCPTRAGRLKSATPAGHVNQAQAEERLGTRVVP